MNHLCSSDRAKRLGLKGHPWQEDLDTGNRGEQMLPVSTIAVEFEHSTFINFIKPSLKAIAYRTDHYGARVFF